MVYCAILACCVRVEPVSTLASCPGLPWFCATVGRGARLVRETRGLLDTRVAVCSRVVLGSSVASRSRVVCSAWVACDSREVCCTRAASFTTLVCGAVADCSDMLSRLDGGEGTSLGSM